MISVLCAWSSRFPRCCAAPGGAGCGIAFTGRRRARARSRSRWPSGSAPPLGTGGGAGAGAGTATGTRAVHVNLDAWSVNTGADGSVTITVRQLLDKAELEKALAAAGIPAVVIFGGSCLFKDFGSASEPGRKLTGDPRTWVKDLAIGHFLTLYPAGVPSGDDVVIEMSYGADGKKSGPVFGFRLALLPQGTALSCPDSAKLGAVVERPGSRPCETACWICRDRSLAQDLTQTALRVLLGEDEALPAPPG